MELKNFWKKITNINWIHAVPTIVTGTMNEPSKRKNRKKKNFLINVNAKATREKK